MIKMVKNFTYFGSNLPSDQEVTCEVKCQASKAFGALIILIFNYLINTKRTAYNTAVISILLYGAET